MKPKKHLGQNFLINQSVIKKITDSVNTQKNVVLEIGPGRGALSSVLIEKSLALYAFEIDESLKEYLNPLEEKHSNFTVIYDDVLKINFNEFLKEKNLNDVYLIANIPYYITGPLLNKIKDTKQITLAIVMMQKEVGDRLLSTYNNKEYGYLSVIFNFYFDITKVVNVKRTSFFPKPKVDSVVLKFVRTNKYLNDVNDIKHFNEFVEASFKMKRKTLVNNLTNHYQITKDEVINKLKQIEPSFNVFERAENVSIKRFIKFSNGWKI